MNLIADAVADQTPWHNGDPLPDPVERSLIRRQHRILAEIVEAANRGDVDETVRLAHNLGTVRHIERTRHMIRTGSRRAYYMAGVA